jgi:hypothetical protein
MAVVSDRIGTPGKRGGTPNDRRVGHHTPVAGCCEALRLFFDLFFNCGGGSPRGPIAPQRSKDRRCTAKRWMRCRHRRPIGIARPPTSAADVRMRNDVGRAPGSSAATTGRRSEAAPVWRRSAPLRLERRWPKGGGGGRPSITDAIQLRRPPGEAWPGSARASGPGAGSWTSRAAELKRGEIQDDQRSQ